MLKKFFFYTGISAVICGISLLIFAFKSIGHNYGWEPGSTGSTLFLNGLFLFFISYCVTLSANSKLCAFVSAAILIAGIGLQCADQSSIYFSGKSLVFWQDKEKLLSYGFMMAVALLIVPLREIIAERLDRDGPHS